MTPDKEAALIAPILAANAVLELAAKIDQRTVSWTELSKKASDRTHPPTVFYDERISHDKALRAELVAIAASFGKTNNETPC